MGGKQFKVDFISEASHYFAHQLPIWKALPAAARGDYYTRKPLIPELEAYGVEAKSFEDLEQSTNKRLILASSFGDLRNARTRGRKVIMTEHGAGQSYEGSENGSYIGSPDRAGVVAVLTPGQKQADKQLDTHPTIPVFPVGVPKLDPLHQAKKPPAEPGTIAISFHWDCRVVQETRSAFRFYRRVLGQIAEQYPIIGHGHPRDWKKYEQFWRGLKVEPVEDFAEVIERAEVYVCDNSSTIYEWASLDRPVVVLNAPIYRRHIEHGMRFWEHADIGIQANRPQDLAPAIEQALKDPSEVARRRRAIVKETYATTDGNAAQKAAEAVLLTIERWPQYQ